MAEMLFPERQRCKACSKALGKPNDPTVLLGLYCSPKCARIAFPAVLPENAPRECKTQRDGAWIFKRRYRSVSEIPDRLREDPSTSWYWCSHCAHLHIGHTRMGEAEQFRMFDDLDTDLPDMLVKLRGAATHRQVAEVAGVRPIRIKELEMGVAHPEGLKTLAKLMKTYRVRLGVALPQSRR